MCPPHAVPLPPPLLADLVVALHLAVVIAMATLTVAVPFAWVASRLSKTRGGVPSWVQSPWLRWPHIAVFAYIAVNAALGKLCVLTVLENRLRREAGAQGEEEFSFVGRMLHEILFTEISQTVLDRVYLALFLLTVAMLFLLPPRRPASPRSTRIAQ
ncbi:MAG TPA: DUF2784 family protein [Planctomycetes bacterium]|nr:DUF2784 family protein [Planctomycetota bacterium]